MKQNRRKFIQSIGLAAGAGLVSVHPIGALAAASEQLPVSGLSEEDDKPFTISILQTTDVHCQVHPHDELFWENDEKVYRKTGGYAHLATYLKQFRKKNPDTFLVDTGDMFQGSELSVKTTGTALVPILDALDYNLYLPGNWEVIYSKKNMQTLLGALKAPKVCANMYHDLGNGVKGELVFQPYHIWNVQGVKIGFIGYTDPLVPIRQSPIYSKGITYTKPEENIAHYIDVLKNQEQCAFVLVVAHLGLSQQIHLANLEVCKGVDYILGGDTHERVRKPIQCKYAKVVEPGAFGSFVGKLNLTIQNGKVIQDEYELVEIDPNQFGADKKVKALINELEQPFQAEINQIIGYSTIPLYRYFVIENPIDTLVLNAIRWKVKDVDVVLSNGFRFCPPRTTPDETGNIPINSGFVYDMLPVNSPIRRAQVSGKKLREWMEKELNNVFAKEAAERLGGWVIKFNGMKVRFLAFGEKGKRVKEMTIADEAVQDDKIYSICACERDGDPEDMLCRIKGVQNAFNTPYSLHDAMTEYLKTQSPVTPTPQKNAVALDVSDALLTQVSGVDYTFR
ncbi:MAG: metallophosphoesterase [Chitinophagaceae bacterium]|nr:metallophosphoesterase [Chitinophagaceae bacterium]